jgi:hypothetical protein
LFFSFFVSGWVNAQRLVVMLGINPRPTLNGFQLLNLFLCQQSLLVLTPERFNLTFDLFLGVLHFVFPFSKIGGNFHRPVELLLLVRPCGSYRTVRLPVVHLRFQRTYSLFYCDIAGTHLRQSVLGAVNPELLHPIDFHFVSPFFVRLG